ncbi:hypothetical protein ACFV28_13350 [Streptomyces sp. NPDC059720]|uniref:hypothetical protein n=1 Tax=Streptomyces sp. NPDC059720 TaxID=3346924 RepID=UPI0036831BBC
MTPPDAALAVLRAALVDTRHTSLEDAQEAAERVVDALAADGWTLAPLEVENGRQTPAQTFVTNR